MRSLFPSAFAFIFGRSPLRVVQAIKQKWLESKEMDAESDTQPLSDVEYDDQPGESDAGGETPGGSLAAAGTSSQKRTQTQDHTPPPPKRRKKQVSGGLGRSSAPTPNISGPPPDEGLRPAVLECAHQQQCLRGFWDGLRCS
jgi:hypothetical protein